MRISVVLIGTSSQEISWVSDFNNWNIVPRNLFDKSCCQQVSEIILFVARWYSGNRCSAERADAGTFLFVGKDRKEVWIYWTFFQDFSPSRFCHWCAETLMNAG
jgi:hypothetical protein